MKKIISLLLSIIMIVSVAAVGVITTNAAVTKTFTDENGIRWTVTESYPGWAIAPADKSQIIGTIEIPATYDGKAIIAISSNAFSSVKSNSWTVIIPESIMAIGAYAFQNSSIVSIDIPESVTSLGGGCFSSCASLEHIDLSNNIRLIPNSCFSGCSSLDNINLPANLLSIKETAFSNSGIVSLDIPNSVNSIGNSCFENCSNLSHVKLPTSMHTLNKWVFEKCSSLENIDLSHITYIVTSNAFMTTTVTNPVYGNFSLNLGGAFSGCHNLKNVIFSDELKSIPVGTFTDCISLETIIFPNSLESIGNTAFENCYSLVDIDFNDNLVSIGDAAFAYCSSLQSSLSFGSKLRSVGQSAFGNCPSISSVVFADYNSIDYIGKSAFPSNLGVKAKGNNYNYYTFVKAGEFKQDGIDWEVMNNKDGYTIRVKSSSRDYSGDVIVPSEYNGAPITELAYNCFYNCPNITGVTIPQSVKRLGSESNVTFGGTTSLSYVNFPDNIEFAHYGKMFANSGLKSIVLPRGVKTLSGEMFRDSKIESIVIQDGVTEIPEYFCYSLKSLKNLVLPDSIVSINRDAFGYCENLNISGLPTQLQSLGEECFIGCKKLSVLNFPVGLTDIGDRAFKGCTKVSGNLFVPSTVQYVGRNAFTDCYSVNSIVIDDGVDILGTECFSNIGTLNSVTLNSNMLSIDGIGLAFYNDNILEWNVPNVTNYNTPLLSSGALKGNVELGDDVVITNEYAFYGNDDMSITTPVTNRNVIMYARRNAIPLTIIDPITESGGSKDAIVTLDYDTANLRVTVPTVLPVSVDSDNNVTVATEAKIINYSNGQVDVTNAVLSGSNTWALAAFDTDFTKVPVDTKQYGFQLLGYNVPVDGNAFNNQFDTIDGDSVLDLSYNANVAIQSESINAAEIGKIIFTVAWHK